LTKDSNYVILLNIKFNEKYISSEFKQKLLVTLLKVLKITSKFKKPLLLIGKILLWPCFILYKITFYTVFLPAYKLNRQLKKIIASFASKNQDASKNHSYYLPLIIIVLIGLLGVINNLQAKPIHPEKYGQKNILYKITNVGEYFTDEDLESEIEEGPLSEELSPVSYLAEEALTEESPAATVEEKIDSLVATTQDESALISPEITDPEAITKKRDKVINYTVESGDTISTIAKNFNISVVSMLWENNLSYYSTIKPGQTLKILPISGISHKIKSGDTLQKIAKTYQADVEKIIEFNKLASATDIQAGQSIIIPEGVKPVAYTATVTKAPSIINIFTPSVQSGSKLQWPTNSRRITQYFRWRHAGLDIGNKTGQPIYAAESGRVEQAGWSSGGYGYFVIINHGGGLKTLYAHASRILVKVGEAVSRGQVIAAIGSTGYSTGPHLHFEVRINGVKTDPLQYIR